MTALSGIWRRISGPKRQSETESSPVASAQAEARVIPIDLDISPNDPFLVYLQHSTGPVEVEKLTLDSPALDTLRQAGINMVVPLISQGELIGLINLGARMSEQEYSGDDRKLLGDLAAQAAPALRVAQLARLQQLEARRRERMEQELRVARLIQQTLLPKDVPHLPGWQLTTYYQPAREVGGDFYDFLTFPNGRVGIVVGDVTDKGVPAALVMATTRSILRGAAERLETPGAVLERVNELLQPDIPPNMFVTCFFALLDPETGILDYANAGHDVPYLRTDDGVLELRATGMPLGLLPGMDYEEKQVQLKGGETVLFHSDGLVEAHNPEREMFGFPRLRDLVGQDCSDTGLTQFLLSELHTFAGEGWEQEDDVTLVTLHRSTNSTQAEGVAGDGLQTLIAFEMPSAPGNERQAMLRVAEAAAALPLSDGQMERLKTAVAEAVMNAMEHGNKYQEDVPVGVQVMASPEQLVVRIRDRGTGESADEAETPDLAAKLAGEQSPRGWGLFLIRNMVDELRTLADDDYHTIDLVMKLTHDSGEE